ncbi:sensor histidine kinase [Paraconexibacter algicola]|uniref:histidine kinase n=1 Tax=Paraconexibacter algicola TaxID=2133960 RepID=A0A2T4UIB9_9ACTN|nr:ATP-binding protein [Paraconexibacter algicola]PTL58968.1 hypothetical protein C7Y72_04545 [Paraconexibacter algicola]
MSDRRRIDILDRAGLAVRAPDEDPDIAVRVISLRFLMVVRIVGLAVTIAAGALGDPQAAYWVVAAVALAAQLASARVAFSARWERTSEHLVPLLGLSLVSGLVLTSGGAASPAAHVAIAFPAIGAFILGRVRVLASCAVVFVALAVPVLPDVLAGEPGAGRTAVGLLCGLGFAAAVAVAIAAGRTILGERLADLYRERRLLLVDELATAATERRRISAELGAGPLQLLLAAKQDLEELAEPGGDEAAARTRSAATLHDAARLLRATIVALREPRAGADPPEDAAPMSDPQIAGRLLAIVQLVAVPTFGAATIVGAADGGELGPAIALVGLVAVVQLTVLAVAFGPHWDRLPQTAVAVACTLAVATATALSGGAQSPVLIPAAVLPMSFLLLGPGTVQAPVAGALVVGLAATILPDVAQGEPGAGVAMAVTAMALVWTGLAAFVGTLGRQRLEQRTARLETARRTLLRDSVAVQERERGAVARALHDDVLQLVLAAAQETAEPDPDAPARALAHTTAAVAALREGADALHPSALEHGGLAPALRDIAARAARLGGPTPRVRVADGVAARHHELVVGVARELLTNVAKHASATGATVEVTPDGPAVALVVTDDGCGMPPARPQRALESGHVGLASCREQVEAAGGTVELRSAPGEGTTVRVWLP